MPCLRAPRSSTQSCCGNRRGARRRPLAGLPAEDGRTRDRVTGLLLEHGPQTATELAARLGISAAAVRRHLDGLVAAGRVTRARAAGGQRGRGRPARHFALTDAGRRSAFPHAYDDLAAAALRFVAERGGTDAVRAVAEQQVAGARGAVPRRGRAGPAPPSPGPRCWPTALTAEGYAATASAISSGGQLCQHHCPVAHVAAEFPQLCEAETAVFAGWSAPTCSGWPPSPTATGVCTTHVPSNSGTPVPAGSAVAHDAGASTTPAPSIDRERTPA